MIFSTSKYWGIKKILYDTRFIDSSFFPCINNMKIYLSPHQEKSFLRIVVQRF